MALIQIALDTRILRVTKMCIKSVHYQTEPRQRISSNQRFIRLQVISVGLTMNDFYKLMTLKVDDVASALSSGFPGSIALAD